MSVVSKWPPGDVIVHRAVEVPRVWSHYIVPPLENVSGGPGHGIIVLRINVEAVDAGEVRDDPALKHKHDNVLKIIRNINKYETIKMKRTVNSVQDPINCLVLQLEASFSFWY